MQHDLVVDGSFLIAFYDIAEYSTMYFEYSDPIDWDDLKEIEIDPSKKYKIRHVASDMAIRFFLEIID